MLKRLLRPLLEPIAAKLDKLLDRTSEGFKKQQQRQSETRQKQSERMNMLSRQIDDTRDEIIRGFARQDAKMKKQFDEVMLRLAKLGALSGSRPGAVANSTPGAPEMMATQNGQGCDVTEANPLAEMMLKSGDEWLKSQAEGEKEA
jgi:hypothetical protein